MRNFLIVTALLTSTWICAMEYGSVVFSELMVDPEPRVGLPAVEYVEICNRSDRTVSLQGWTLYYGDKTYPMPERSLSAGAYLLLCAKTSAATFSSDISVFGMSSFPSLLNSGKTMALVSYTNELICCLDYSDSWYGSGFKANGGWSLECIDLSNCSGESDNWAASVDATGGTPGCINSVNADNPSHQQTICTGLGVPDPNSIELHFSNFMQPTVLNDILNYRISPSNSIVQNASTSFPDTRIVTLTLSDSLVSEAVYELFLTNLQDLSGISMPDTTLLLGLPENPEIGSLQLNEILFNPLPGGSDYVEFVNVGTKCVDLSRVWLTNRSASGVLNAGKQLSDKSVPCLPRSYWLLSQSPDSVFSSGKFPRGPNVLTIAGFPSLPDDAGNIALVTTSAEILDAYAYTEKLHFSLISNPEGVALEKIRPEMPSDVPANWISANSSSNYGTPGFQNSQYCEQIVSEAKGFYTSQAWMTPNNDGRNDRVNILYELPVACAGNLTVYDLQGRIVRILANNELFASQGSYFWDGLRDDGRLAAYGRYILFAEAYSPAGRIIRKRLVLTILF